MQIGIVKTASTNKWLWNSKWHFIFHRSWRVPSWSHFMRWRQGYPLVSTSLEVSGKGWVFFSYTQFWNFIGSYFQILPFGQGPQDPRQEFLKFKKWELQYLWLWKVVFTIEIIDMTMLKCLDMPFMIYSLICWKIHIYRCVGSSTYRKWKLRSVALRKKFQCTHFPL